jgi:alanine dehydrogenase
MWPRGIFVDISIDQRGCFEDSRLTTHDPTYEVHESKSFCCVANMPVRCRTPQPTR